MNWTKVSAISDVIVAISVIVSLVYVANQIKQNTNAIELSAVVSTSEIWAGPNLLLAEDEKLNEIFWAGMRGDDSMSETDQNRYAAFKSIWIQVFQQSFLLYESGTMNSDLWDNQLRAMQWFFTNPGSRTHWKNWKSSYVPSFVEYVDENILAQTASMPENAGVLTP